MISKLWFGNARLVFTVLLVTVLALGLRLSVLSLLRPVPIYDAHDYIQLGRNLAVHGTYTNPEPTSWWVPGWPFVIALILRFSDSIIAVQIIGALFGTISVWLVGLIAARLGMPARVQALAMFGTAVFPTLVLLPGTALSENLAIPILLLFCLLIIMPTDRMLVVVLLGLVLGALVLVRESFLSLVPVMLLRFATADKRGHRLFNGVLATAVLVLILAPWIIRNCRTTGVCALSTSSALNTWISLGPTSDGKLVAVPIDTWVEQDDPHRERVIAERAVSEALDAVRANPGRIVTLAPGKFRRFWMWEDWITDFLVDRSGTRLIPGLPGLLWVPLLQIPYTLLVLGALLGAVRLYRIGGIWILAVVSFVALPHFLLFGVGRFHVPIEPLLILMFSLLFKGPTASVAGRPMSTSANRDGVSPIT